MAITEEGGPHTLSSPEGEAGAEPGSGGLHSDSTRHGMRPDWRDLREAAEEGFGTEKECFNVHTDSPPHPRALCLAFNHFPDRNIWGRNSDICIEHVQAFLSSFPKHRSANIYIAFTVHEALKVI